MICWAAVFNWSTRSGFHLTGSARLGSARLMGHQKSQTDESAGRSADRPITRSPDQLPTELQLNFGHSPHKTDKPGQVFNGQRNDGSDGLCKSCESDRSKLKIIFVLPSRCFPIPKKTKRRKKKLTRNAVTASQSKCGTSSIATPLGASSKSKSKSKTKARLKARPKPRLTIIKRQAASICPTGDRNWKLATAPTRTPDHCLMLVGSVCVCVCGSHSRRFASHARITAI